jgi:hypothetical protein
MLERLRALRMLLTAAGPGLWQFSEATLAQELLVQTLRELSERRGGSAQLLVLLFQPRDLRLALLEALFTLVVVHIVVLGPIRVRRNATPTPPGRTILKAGAPF